MNNELIINKIYENTIKILLSDISNNYKEEISKSYIEYLKNIYSNFDFNGKDIYKLISTFTELETSKWKNSSPEVKLSELLKDEAMENVRYVSNVGYKYAKERLDKKFNNETFVEPTISIEKANENIELLKTYSTKVKEFNKMLAIFFVSEGSIDFEYACGNTDKMSSRIGRLKH